MSILVHCAECAAQIKVAEKFQGKKGRCPKCKGVIVVPRLQSDPDSSGMDKSKKRSPKREPVQRKRADERPAVRPTRARQRAQKTTNKLWYFVGGGFAAVVLVAAILFATGGEDEQALTAQTPVRQTGNISVDSGLGSPTESREQPELEPVKETPETVTTQTNPKEKSEKPEPPTESVSVEKAVVQNANPQPNSISQNNTSTVTQTKTATVSKSKVVTTNSKPSLSSASVETSKLSLKELLRKTTDGVVMINILNSAGENLGLGSGFVIDQENLIATNYHVIGSASKATALFHDGTVVEVKGVRAFDKQRDLAIIEVEQLPASAKILTLSTGEIPEAGSEVVAIGHPRGLKFTSSQGIINATHRTDELPQGIQEFLKAPQDQLWLQTDAQINKGSSGGPLFNDQGEVIGMNTWVVSDVTFGFASHVSHLLQLKSSVTEKVTALEDLDAGRKALRNILVGMPEELEKLFNDYRRKREEYQVKLEAAETREQIRHLVLKENPANTYINELMKYARSSKEDRTSFQAYHFALVVATEIYPEEKAERHVREATQKLLKKHLDEKDLQVTALVVSGIDLKLARLFLKHLKDKSEHLEVQGVATLMLAKSLAAMEDQNQQRDELVTSLLETVVQKYPDVVLMDSTLRELAEPRLYEKEHLAIGKEAPEIVGQDTRGQNFALSEYRGKVVMLDFYADWCPYCQKMYPHERLLMEQLKEKPFALLGVNADSRERLGQIRKEGKVQWRSWMDGPGGPIAEQWQVSSFPTVVLIDHEGVIRYRFSGMVAPEILEQALQELLQKAGA